VASEKGLYTSAMGGSPVRPGVGELLGTFILVYVGCAVAVAATLERPIGGAPYDSLAVALAFGVALLIVVAALGHITGGHVNPAVTVGLAAAGKFPWQSVPLYLGAQLGGAVLAGLAVWLSFGDEARDQANLAAPAVAQGVSTAQAFVVEALITFILVFVVVLVASDPRVPSSRIAAVAVGFALAAGVFIGGPLTGGGANPARSFGPMLLAGEFGDFWLYILAPLVGGLIAAFAGDFLLKAFSPEEDGDNGGDTVDDAAESRIAARTRLPGSRAAGLR
jgi:MIP family channel proteins